MEKTWSVQCVPTKITDKVSFQPKVFSNFIRSSTAFESNNKYRNIIFIVNYLDPFHYDMFFKCLR